MRGRFKTNLIVSTLATLFPLLAGAESPQLATTEDGRQVQLHADGSWSYIQRDRYATSAKGERFVLSPNGSWRRLMPDDSVSTTRPAIQSAADFGLQAQATTADQAPGETVDIVLTQVVVKRTRSKALKSSRTDSETHFSFRLSNASDQPLNIAKPDKQAFTAQTSRGRKLKVQRIEADPAAITPGEHLDITVVCSGSPRWKSVEYLRLTVLPGAVGNQRAHILDRSLRDVEFTQVKSL